MNFINFNFQSFTSRTNNPYIKKAKFQVNISQDRPFIKKR